VSLQKGFSETDIGKDLGDAEKECGEKRDVYHESGLQIDATVPTS